MSHRTVRGTDSTHGAAQSWGPVIAPGRHGARQSHSPRASLLASTSLHSIAMGLSPLFHVHAAFCVDSLHSASCPTRVRALTFGPVFGASLGLGFSTCSFSDTLFSCH